MLQDSQLHHLSTEWLGPHISLKHQYTAIAGARRHMGMKAALKKEGIPLEGTHPRRIRGGHPWEICRGGNTTHIGMRVMRPNFSEKKGFVVELYGHAGNRLAETVKMFLAIHREGLPIDIVEPENIRKRLLCQDNIGILPEYESLRYGERQFHPEDDVFDVLYLADLGRYRRRLLPFIRWEVLPGLRLRGI